MQNINVEKMPEFQQLQSLAMEALNERRRLQQPKRNAPAISDKSIIFIAGLPLRLCSKSARSLALKADTSVFESLTPESIAAILEKVVKDGASIEINNFEYRAVKARRLKIWFRPVGPTEGGKR